jgi:hypothetical protein
MDVNRINHLTCQEHNVNVRLKCFLSVAHILHTNLFLKGYMDVFLLNIHAKHQKV